MVTSARNAAGRGRPTNRIAELRQREGWSMDELGARCYPPTTGSEINKLEKSSRRLTLEWMLRISDALGCHPNDLLPEPAPTVRPESREIAAVYEGLSEADQEVFRRVLTAMARPQTDSPRDPPNSPS